MLKVGQKAPDFKAAAYFKDSFKDVQLSQYKGQWVALFFYPGDFTFICPTEIASVASRYDEMQKLGVQVLAVSTDSSFSHKAWHDQELSKMVPGGIPFPLVSDQNGSIGKSYEIYDEEAAVNNRGRFLIDPDGIIQSIELLNPLAGCHVGELFRQIRALQHIRNTGEAIPAGWEPGKVTIKHGPGLVGKIWEVWKPEI